MLPLVADRDNLRLAFWKARKGKNHAREVEAYRENLESNLVLLREQILSGGVLVGDYRYFKVFEPKERQICASAFREQVLHHALMNVCHDYFERVQIFDSYASRKGKGTHAALDRAGEFHHSGAWYLKLDVRKFFESVHHRVLKDQLNRLFKDYSLLAIFHKIIDSYAATPERGLPIGNLTSQYFANHYLSGLDHFIKNELRVRSYIRYMDDMVLWHKDKNALWEAFGAINEFVQTRLFCTLKPEQLNKTEHGLPFLGYRIFPYQTKLTQGSKRRFVKKMEVLEANYHDGTWDESTCQRRALPLLDFARRAETRALRTKIIVENIGQSP